MANGESIDVSTDSGTTITSDGGPNVWPPPPRLPVDEKSPVSLAEVRPPTPGEAFRFFLWTCTTYGLVCGMLYGAGVGVFCCVPFAGGVFGSGGVESLLIGLLFGAVYGFAIGAVTGLSIGFVDGIVIGAYAYSAYRRGRPSTVVGRRVSLLAPILTYVLAVTVAAFIFQTRSPWDFGMQMIYAVAAFASWDASKRAVRRFAEIYA